jgi:PKD repeat protein
MQSIVDQVVIQVPVASFTISNANPDTTDTVIFTDTSTGAPASWVWAVSGGAFSFVNGTSATSQNPQIQFTDASTSYTVNLTATNADGSDSTNFINNITTVAIQVPVASFTISNATPDITETVTLTDTSTESPTSWSWTITGAEYRYVNGTSSSSQNPQVRFDTILSTYDITLQATNASGSDTTPVSEITTTQYVYEGDRIFYYPFEFGDADSNGITAPTVYGTPTYDSSGFYDFDGSDDAFSYSQPNGYSDSSGYMEFFFSIQNTAAIVFNGSSNLTSSDRIQILAHRTSNLFRLNIIPAGSGNDINLEWNFGLDSNKWYHVILNKTADAGSSPNYNYEFYVDGVSQGNPDTDNSGSSTGLWFDDIDNVSSWNVGVGGQIYNGGSLPVFEIDGQMMLATIDSNFLSQSDVSARFEALCNALPKHFDFDPFQYGDADNGGTQVPTTYGSPTYNSAGYYSFDGTDDAFYYDYDGGINDATGAIEVFFDWDNSTESFLISFSRDNTSNYRGAIAISTDLNLIQFSLRRASSSDEVILRWNFAGTSGKYHIVLNKTADGGTSPSYNYEMYINGVNQGNPDANVGTASQGYWFDDVDGFTPFNITVGAIVYGGLSLPDFEFEGDIYRAAIYKAPLSAQAVSARYNYLLNRIK